ncbi:MAG: pyridoxamine 5'-phosphate oxidase family protein [Piscirickettsiaceae bacterium]|nr:pyridoxamine 5'-phosphate oxidase family protein [Piscirickettsiaceae bacterium]
MKQYASDIAFTDSVKKIQTRYGSRKSYAKIEQNWWPDTITPDLATFIAERDSFYMATVNSDGQPYIQHRGGPKGFLKVLDDHTLGFADFRGNRQYISYGNLEENNKVSLFLMDYPNRGRIKIWGTAEVKEDDQDLINQLSVADYKGKAERAFIIRVETWDGNCSQHITPRYSIEEMAEFSEK